MRVGIREANHRRVNLGLSEHTLRQPGAKFVIAIGENIEHFEFSTNADALRVGSTVERAVLLARCLRLHLQHLRDDCLEQRRFSIAIALRVAGRHSEVSSQEQHDPLVRIILVKQ